MGVYRSVNAPEGQEGLELRPRGGFLPGVGAQVERPRSLASMEEELIDQGLALVKERTPVPSSGGQDQGVPRVEHELSAGPARPCFSESHSPWS